MFQKNTDAWSLAAWLIVAASAPFALLAGKQDWIGLTVAAVLTGAFCFLVTGRKAGRALSSRWYCAVQFVFLIPMLAYFASWSQDAWPTGGDFPVVPLTLLSLAVLSSWHGAQCASRVGAVLFWLIAGLYGVLLTFGSKDLHIHYLMPQYEPAGMEAMLVLLLPAIVQFIPREMKPAIRLTSTFIGVLFVVLSVWTVCALSAPVAMQIQWPFYEAGKSISVLGIAERLESFISVAVTVGCFALFSLLLSASGHLAEVVRPGWGRYGVIAAGAAAAALMLSQLQISTVFLLFGAVLLWGLLPVLTGLFFNEKKSKK